MVSDLSEAIRYLFIFLGRVLHKTWYLRVRHDKTNPEFVRGTSAVGDDMCNRRLSSVQWSLCRGNPNMAIHGVPWNSRAFLQWWQVHWPFCEGKRQAAKPAVTEGQVSELEILGWPAASM